MGVLGCRMPDFESTPDPANPRRHLISRCDLDVDDFHTESQGIWIAQKCLFQGVQGVMDDLSPNAPSQIALTGTFSVARAAIYGCKEVLEASYDGHFIIRDHASGAELIDVEWTWLKGRYIRVVSVTFADDALRIEAYFNGLKLPNVKKLEIALADWHQQMPRFAEMMLMSSGYIIQEFTVEAPVAPVVHVETDWDVLS